ncbi:GSCOCG00013394001-RA-CDS [Cotesia congregata]|nr:GSCOCG00013394001-RA-CDS [Cotesia congregata]
MDLLSSFYLCLRSQNYIMVYTFNPFTNYAPHPWKEVEVTNKPDPRWTSYNLRLTQDNDMCRLLQFDKSKLLNGYPVRISAYANISFQLHSTMFNNLNLTTRIDYDLQFQKLMIILGPQMLLKGLTII